jgi:hypothetical protein
LDLVDRDDTVDGFARNRSVEGYDQDIRVSAQFPVGQFLCVIREDLRRDRSHTAAQPSLRSV